MAILRKFGISSFCAVFMLFALAVCCCMTAAGCGGTGSKGGANLQPARATKLYIYHDLDVLTGKAAAKSSVPLEVKKFNVMIFDSTGREEINKTFDKTPSLSVNVGEDSESLRIEYLDSYDQIKYIYCAALDLDNEDEVYADDIQDFENNSFFTEGVLNKEKVTLAVGESVKLEIMGYFKADGKAFVQDLSRSDAVTWESSDDIKMSSDGHGSFTAYKTGECKAQASYIGKLATCDVTINPPIPVELKVLIPGQDGRTWNQDVLMPDGMTLYVEDIRVIYSDESEESLEQGDVVGTLTFVDDPAATLFYDNGWVLSSYSKAGSGIAKFVYVDEQHYSVSCQFNVEVVKAGLTGIFLRGTDEYIKLNKGETTCLVGDLVFTYGKGEDDIVAWDIARFRSCDDSVFPTLALKEDAGYSADHLTLEMDAKSGKYKYIKAKAETDDDPAGVTVTKPGSASWKFVDAEYNPIEDETLAKTQTVNFEVDPAAFMDLYVAENPGDEKVVQLPDMHVGDTVDSYHAWVRYSDDSILNKTEECTWEPSKERCLSCEYNTETNQEVITALAPGALTITVSFGELGSVRLEVNVLE